MAELSQPTKTLIAKYELWRKSLKPKEGVSTIHVDEVASKVAAFYEQFRTIVDWKEEHLMRRAAIIRKLRQRFADLESKNVSANNFAEPLIMELIRGGYFANDKIEETKIADVQKIIDKYIFILKNSPPAANSKDEASFYDRLLEIAACEIEELLDPSLKEIALIEYMFTIMRERIKVSDKIFERNIIKKEDKDIQIYIAVQQALFKLDDPIISYNLIKYKYKNWDNPTQEQLLAFAQNIHGIILTINKDLACPIAKKFYKICEKYDAAYLLIGDILSRGDLEKLEKEITDPALLEGYAKSAYNKRLVELKAKIRRAAIYSTLSIFITKILTALIILLILAKIFGQPFSFEGLAIDILIPTALMAFLVLTIKPPSKQNLNLVVVEIMKIFYEKEKVDTYEVRANKKKSVVMTAILSLMYLLGACITFGLILWAFIAIRLDTPSIIINLVFIALILFAGTAVQKKAKELTIEEDSGGFLTFITDILFLPVTGVGQYLSNKWKRYNAITAVLNALIDMPFSLFVEFIERWRYFIRERKEEM